MTGFRKPGTVLEGWLTKKKGSSDKWDRKYFVLTNERLIYYTPRIKGNVNLVNVVVERVENPDQLSDAMASPRLQTEV